MDYSKMSDFEINKRVAISVGFPCYYGDGSYTNNLGLKGAIVKGENDSGLFMVGEFDPCNNPADAWPIIVGHKISLINADDEWLCVPDDTAVDGTTGDDVQMIYSGDGHVHANPLRAAMVVFLMLQEKSNADV
ncbi:phage protein NinX family protein [Leclercia sp. UBA5958]|uniref:phage protein NinX family protein n=1 Tax=Leclercia sp. UBA5958 TaxID=1946742 RepID=UPI00257B601B|nr:phage protein NinX family protein [Leclercia sp. UBA5958]